MDLDRFLGLVAAVFGALGSIYVLKGIAALSPNLIERMARSNWGFSVAQIDALTAQKADSMVGIVLIAVALAISVVTIAAVPEGIRLFEHRGLAVAVAAALAGTAYIALVFAGGAIHRHQRLVVGKIITAQQLTKIFERGTVQNYDPASLRVHADQLLGLSAPADEAPEALIKRLAAEVGLSVPESLDYSRVLTPEAQSK